MKLSNWALFPGVATVMKNKKVRLALIPALLVVVLLSPPLAKGQVFYQGPPSGLDLVNASDADLDSYGFPPRPDPSETVAYNAWLRLVSTPQTRLENPTVEVTSIINGPAQNWSLKGTNIGNSTAVESTNWSGVAIGTKDTFSANKSAVYTQFVMPAMGVDNCAYKPYYMSWWVGFDGASNGDVLQAGTISTNCSTTYSVWYEWFESGCTSTSAMLPCNQTNLSLPVTAGDYLGIEVWYTTTSPNGHAYVLNFTTGKSVSVGFDQPKGTAKYVGSSVEWIAERPALVTSSGTTLTNLANYVGQPSDVDYAYDGVHTYYPSSSPAGTTIYDITMICPPWDPSTACKSTTGLSKPYVPGAWSMWTFDEGPAYQ
jgi:hypothetical protein